MRILLYVGAAPSRDQVLEFSAPIVQRATTGLTLVSGGGAAALPLLHDALARLQLPDGLPHTMLTFDGDAGAALMQAADQRSHDLAIIGRLQPPLQRFLRGQRSKLIAQRLEPAVLRVHAHSGPIRRILLASGGDAGTLQNARFVARLARPLGASVTIMHVLSQQLLYFDGFEAEPLTVDIFLGSDLPEAAILREAEALLQRLEVPATVIGRRGPVVQTVVAEADGYDLLVIGSHRIESPLDRMLIEDITGDLLDLSPLPILVTKVG